MYNSKAPRINQITLKLNYHENRRSMVRDDYIVYKVCEKDMIHKTVRKQIQSLLKSVNDSNPRFESFSVRYTI